MKKIFLLVIVGISFIACVKTVDFNTLQNRNRVMYEKGKKTPYTGETIRHHRNGKVSLNGTLVDGKFDKTVTKYYENGQIKLKMFYKKNQKTPYTGEAFTYFENGKIDKKFSFIDGKKLSLMPILLKGVFGIQGNIKRV